jgi:hypothetical protein
MLSSQLLNTAAAINATTTFLIGCTLNLAIIWLAFKRSPKALRTYSRVLLQTAVLNIVYLTVVFLYIPVGLSGTKGAVNYGVGWIMLIIVIKLINL